jgi:hypothetical protein
LKFEHISRVQLAARSEGRSSWFRCRRKSETNYFAAAVAAAVVGVVSAAEFFPPNRGSGIFFICPKETNTQIRVATIVANEGNHQNRLTGKKRNRIRRKKAGRKKENLSLGFETERRVQLRVRSATFETGRRCGERKSPLFTSAHTLPALPHTYLLRRVARFSWCVIPKLEKNVPNQHKTYQINTKCTKSTQNVPNDNKISHKIF